MIIVVDPTGKEFGRIDNRTAQGLAPLMDGAKQNGLQWIAVTEPRRKTPNEGPPGTSLSLLIALTLQLYCPRKIAHEIGRYLKTRNIMLGDPILDLAKYDYYNPQTQNHFTVKDTTQPEFMAAYTASQHTPANFVVRNVEEIRDDVFSMFDRIVKQEDIPRRQQSSLIKTPLLKHQEQALYFMLDKEAEWFNDEETPKDSLWKVGVDGSGRKTYTHVITGEKRAHKPETIRGGILADEMGLGKTLSILALVVDDESVTAAKTFALKSPPLQHGMRRQVLNSRATLLLCPLSTMVNWKTQVNDHFAQGKGIKWCYYHGPDRKNYTPESLADHDLVITTYHVAANDAFDQKMPLGLINWFRLVLDEAHAIRSGKTKQALAVYSLEAQRRWAVTGTPVQNRLDDLGALFRFLRLKPFSDKAGFNTHIVSPFKAADPDVVPKLQLLVGSLTLRRLKEGNVVLPPRSDQIVRLQFSEDERKLHEWFEQESARQVNAVTSGEKIGGAVYARILKAILNLRLICAHGRDLLGDDALKLTEGMTSENPMELEDEEEYTPTLTRKPAFEMLELLEQTDTDRCQFCRSRVCEPEAGEADDDSDGDDSDSGDLEHSKRNLIGFMTPCYHIICPRHVKQLRSAWSKITAEDGHVTCQFCETRIRPTLFELTRTDREAFDKERERLRRDPKLAKKMGAYTGPHTKTKALLEELEKNKEESLANPDSPPIKRQVCPQ
jgi:SNF2 family DNA or RNA helicase